jgi:hypothetical protein
MLYDTDECLACKTDLEGANEYMEGNLPDMLFPICRSIPRARSHGRAALPALEAKMEESVGGREEFKRWVSRAA